MHYTFQIENHHRIRIDYSTDTPATATDAQSIVQPTHPPMLPIHITTNMQ